jgi:hypothetical protein
MLLALLISFLPMLVAMHDAIMRDAVMRDTNVAAP